MKLYDIKDKCSDLPARHVRLDKSTVNVLKFRTPKFLMKLHMQTVQT